ncbi:siroheme biosynthesis protein MET8 [Histoplasma capsulatum var. duboisii H88]|uniref:precorrin-2 dehydrogenase n=1 Tax=Ajellomyces capsulatus (strain H88) TaxID=544711 RepID=F0UK71_AJEC8|nr:siroheme biosynthesis protein MET8 [Histoplasma capsulatum var. duboisii H88]QSS57336.1 siroheme biosynthesis protein MET8 [Histoplasma capsulatum var. duboisii H88]
MLPSKFPQIQPGGSLIVAWQVKNKHILVVGGGEVAASRIVHALNADAKVTVISPSSGLNDEVSYRIASKQVSHIDRKFEPRDLDIAGDSGVGVVDMVFVAIDDPEESTQIWKLCKQRRIPANIADVPSECDFYFGSVHRDGPLQIMVSTNGNGPKLASMVRKEIASTLPGNTGAAIENVGSLRRRLREIASSHHDGPKRMKWISRICEMWSLEELVEMDEDDIETLLGYYLSDKVPTFEQVRLGEDADWIGFDGSMGFSC